MEETHTLKSSDDTRCRGSHGSEVTKFNTSSGIDIGERGLSIGDGRTKI